MAESLLLVCHHTSAVTNLAGARADMEDSIACLRYYAGAADKIQGAAIEMDDKEKYAIARKEPIG